MNKREKSIFDVGESLLAERLLGNIEAIEKAYQESPEDYLVPFSEAIETLLKRVAAAQTQADKGSLRYICFSFLQSSLYTGNDQIRIDAYDERGFSDLTDTHVYWSPNFIFQYAHDDMVYFREHIKKHILRIWDYEIMTFFARYVHHYFHIIKDILPDLLSATVPPSILGTQALTVTFGGYMDQIVVIFETEQVEQ